MAEDASVALMGLKRGTRLNVLRIWVESERHYHKKGLPPSLRRATTSRSGSSLERRWPQAVRSRQSLRSEGASLHRSHNTPRLLTESLPPLLRTCADATRKASGQLKVDNDKSSAFARACAVLSLASPPVD